MDRLDVKEEPHQSPDESPEPHQQSSSGPTIEHSLYPSPELGTEEDPVVLFDEKVC